MCIEEKYSDEIEQAGIDYQADILQQNPITNPETGKVKKLNKSAHKMLDLLADLPDETKCTIATSGRFSIEDEDNLESLLGKLLRSTKIVLEVDCKKGRGAPPKVALRTWVKKLILIWEKIHYPENATIYHNSSTDMYSGDFLYFLVSHGEKLISYCEPFGIDKKDTTQDIPKVHFSSFEKFASDVLREFHTKNTTK